MAISRIKKVAIVKKFEKIIENNDSFVAFSYKGCSVNNINQVKQSLREKEAKMMITKNSLIKRVLKDHKLDQNDFFNSFEGQTAIAFSNDGLALFDAIVSSQKSIQNIELKNGMIEKQILTSNQVKDLAQYKSKDGIRAQLISLVSNPAQSIYNVLDAYITKNQESK